MKLKNAVCIYTIVFGVPVHVYNSLFSHFLTQVLRLHKYFPFIEPCNIYTYTVIPRVVLLVLTTMWN